MYIINQYMNKQRGGDLHKKEKYNYNFLSSNINEPINSNLIY